MRDNLEMPIGSVKLAEGLSVEDDWFAVKALDSGTLAIGEPAYHQRNWSYLISDGNDSLLFDTGSGRRPIAPLVHRHAKGSVLAFPSHMHFDHLGNINAFGAVMVADLPMLREIEKAGTITPPEIMFLGASEEVEAPTFEVGRWVKPGEVISLGERRLEVVHTPGHSPDSVSLWEPARNRFYAADFIYRGVLYARVPGASLQAYIETTEQLLDLLPQDVEIVCAHGGSKSSVSDMPQLGYDDLRDLKTALNQLLNIKQPCEGEVDVNERMSLIYSVASF